LKAFPKISCTWNTTDRDLCSECYMPTANCISSSTIQYNKAIPLPSVYWTASGHWKSVYYEILILQTATESASCQQNVFIWYWLVGTPQRFSAHNKFALVQTGVFKTVSMGKWIHSS
jgi:hypothetical protein